ncbi:MAG: RnfABCDGE type electron transport complex subunit G [Bacteroidales bacterium]|nr:RnfABCDGE type electron transport complex subunit G [Bacteroidales bacterium]
MAEKLASSFKNILFSLLLITAVTAGILGVVYKYTQQPIEQKKSEKKEKAIKEVLPSYDNIVEEKLAIASVAEKNIFKKEMAADSMTIYKAYKGEELVGIAAETFSDKGFGGRIFLMAGFLPDGTIYKINVLSHSETPGLGSKMTDPGFYQQFENKNPQNFKLTVKKDGGDVDAITAATISSRAYCDAVDKAYNIISNIGGQNNE